MDLNKVTLIGTVGRQPEPQEQPDGRNRTSFRIGTSTEESIEFHDVLAWGKLAEIIASYVKPGSKVYIEGRLRSRATARGRRVVQVEAENLIMLGHRQRV